MNNETFLLTVQDLSQLLKVSVHTIYYWANRAEIPHIKVGKHLRFDQTEVLAFFTNKTHRNNSERSCFTPSRPLLSKTSVGSLKTRNADLAYLGKE